MSTDTHQELAQDATGARGGRRLRRAAVAAVLVAAGTAATVPAPAHAAGGTAPDLRLCFTSGSSAAVGYTVALNRYNASTGRWEDTGRRQTTNTNGCTIFADVLGNRYFYGYASKLHGWVNSCQQAYTAGNSQVKWVPAGSSDTRYSAYGTITGPYYLNSC